MFSRNGLIICLSTLTVLLFCVIQPAISQQQEYSGIIVNKSTGDPVAYATIIFDGLHDKGTSSDKAGHFKILHRATIGKLFISAVGFVSQELLLDKDLKSPVVIQLDPQEQRLEEVVIRPARKVRYSNKNNPAVDFIRQVIGARDQNNARTEDRYTFLAYDKLAMSLSMPNDKVPKSRLLKKFPFLMATLDTVNQPGRSLIPVFMQERATQVTYAQQQMLKSEVLASQERRVDQKFDEDGLDEFMDMIYGTPDIYDHDIQLGNRRFLSPISAEGPIFYKYFLVDTIKTSSPWQMKVKVRPRNEEDALVTGFLYINLDGSYAVQAAVLHVNADANLNWVNRVDFEIDYAKSPAGKYFLSRSRMALDLGVFKQGMSVYGIKTFRASHFNQQLPPLTAASPAEKSAVGESLNVDRFSVLRPEKLSRLELSSFSNVDSLRNNRSFNRYMSLASFIFSGHLDLGKIEVGPINSLYSFNTIEGSRFRFGARTTDAFSRRLVFDGYGAYGTRDRRAKYGLSTTISLTENSIYTFPVRSFTVKHSYDIEIPGQELNYIADDNFILSFKRGVNDKMWYNRKWSAVYLHEFENHLSFKLSFENRLLEPTGALNFKTTADTYRKDMGISEFGAEIRWAPREKFFQGKRYRRIINEGHPIFTLGTTVGVKDLFGSAYNYQRFRFTASKRFFLSQLGYSDVQLEGGLLLGKVSYPLLFIHRANQTYTYQLSSYNLMNFMEFMSDRYAGLNIQHSFHGFFLNKVPLLKRLQLREIVSFKVLTGSLNRSNMPSNNADLLHFPRDLRQETLVSSLSRVPYMEGSVGLGNIFKVLRVDYVRRLSYTDRKHVAPWGIRVKLYVDF
ncbi:DUF5686 family protein [Sphingobacterium sp. Mn56C]|uniref:DUF5686 family protein n=1 Tax=Sphingobacterium sp. Mn56C TaxID=3395261 RepID=UPI003BE5AE76